MINSSLFSRFIPLAFIILVVLFLIKILNLSYPISVVTTNKSTELSVVGEGKVDVVPDTATVNVGISVSNVPSVDAAQNQINETNNAIIAALQKLQIDKKDIKTANYSIFPNQIFEGTTSRISGYNGNVGVSIKVRDVSKVSQVIAAATDAGANEVQGAQFSVENPDKYREDARNMAIENAKKQAAALAKNLGIRLGKVTNIVESPAAGGPVPYFDMAERSVGIGGTANVEPGSQTITSVVTLYFEKK